MTFGNKALKKNNKLEQTINEITQQNKLIIDQLKDNQNNLHLKLFDYQCQIWEDESQTIEGDPQYQEEIRNLNNLRDQTIEQMKQVIRNVQQLQNQQQNQQNQNFQQGQIQDDGDFQNILNQIKQANQLIQETENQLEYFRKTIQFYIDQNINDNDQKQKVKISIMSGLKQISFTVVRQVFERVVQSLKEFKISNERLNQNNQVLQEKLTEQQRENNQSNEQFKGLVDKLNQKTQELIRDRGIQASYNDNQHNYLSETLSRLQEGFFGRLRLNIHQLANNSLALFASENFNIQGNPELISEIESLILNIRNQGSSNDIDSMNQKWERSVNLFENIYNRFDRNNKINQNVQQVISQISVILREISNYKRLCEAEKDRLSNQNVRQ